MTEQNKYIKSNPHHRFVVVKKLCRERASELRLANACGAEEEKAAGRRVRPREPRAAAEDGVRDAAHRVALADDSLGETSRELEKARPVALRHLRHRNARPAGNDLANLRNVWGEREVHRAGAFSTRR